MKFLLLLLICLHAFADTSGSFGIGGVVFSGVPYPFFAAPGVCLNGNGACVITGALNPMVTAVSAPVGSLYLSTDGNLYAKQDSGLSTNWSVFALAAGVFSSIGPFDSNAPGANGITTVGSNIYAQSASATAPGMVNTSTQTFAGNKTFTGNINGVTPTEFGYLSGITSSVQTQISAKLSSIPQKNNIWVDLLGNDSTCVMGDAGRPCLTYAGAMVQVLLSPAISQTNQYIVNFGVGRFNVTSFQFYPNVHLLGHYGQGGDGRLTGNSLDGTNTLIYCTSAPCEFSKSAAYDVADAFVNYVQGMYFQSFQSTGSSLDFGALSNQPSIFFIWKDSYITGSSFGITAKLNDSSAMQFINTSVGQPVVIQGGSNLIDGGSSSSSWTMSTANNFSSVSIFRDMVGGTCFIQTGANFLNSTLGADSITGGNWIDCSTIADEANIFINQESPAFIMGENVTLSTFEFNNYWAKFSDGSLNTNTQLGALLGLGRGLANSIAYTPKVFGTRASPVSISATGFVTNNTNISTSSLLQTIYAAGSTANALTTITASTPISICQNPGSFLEIINPSSTNPILLPWKSAKLEIKGDIILSNGSSIYLSCDGTAWREIARSQGAGSGANNSLSEAISTDGFFSVQSLVNNGSGEAGSRFAGATVSAGTFAITTTAADVGRGAQSLTWDPTATGQTLTTTQISVPQSLFSNKCVAEFDYKGADATINWQIWDGTSIIASFNGGAAVTLATSANWSRQSMGFTCPASGTLGFKFASTANAAIIKLDSLTIRRQFETGALLTGFVSGAGTLTAAKTILEGFNILDGNITANTSSIALKAPLASPTFTGDVNSSTGDILISTGGKGLKIKDGANSKIGTAVLVGGTVTVSNTSVTANSRIFVTSQVDGGVVGFLRVNNIVNATSFDIISSSVADTSTVAFVIIESIP